MKEDDEKIQNCVAQLLKRGFSSITLVDSGATSVVFKARYPSKFNFDLAVKVLFGPYESTWLKRFRREVKILRKIDHPGVSKILSDDVEKLEHHPYFVMEFISGVNLRGHRKSNGGRVPEIDAVRLVSETAKILGDVHDNGIIHRDIHEGNIFVINNKQLKIVDFGTSREQKIESVSETGSYKTFRPIGAMSHCAPEKWINPSEAGPESDVFSLGVVLFRLVTGRYPFWSDSYLRLFQQIQSGEHAVPDNINITDATRELIKEMLAPSLVYRIENMREVVSRCNDIVI